MNFFWYILIGIVAGWLAGIITRGGGFGILVNLLLGIVGGVLGGWVFGLLGFETTNMAGGLTTATVGAILLLWLASLFRSSK